LRRGRISWRLIISLRRRLDPQHLGGPFLHAVRRNERSLDELSLEGGGDLLERNPLRRHHELRNLERS